MCCQVLGFVWTVFLRLSLLLFSIMQLTLLKSFVGGIDTIPKGQYEAAKVLKFSTFATVRYIILPQVTKIVLPSVFNES